MEIKKNVLENSDDVIKKIIKGEELGIELPSMIEIPKVNYINYTNLKSNNVHNYFRFL